MKKLLFFLPLLFCLSCGRHDNENNKLNTLACEYVKLGLTIGQYDTDFVDAYYGPDSLKPKTPALDDFPGDSLLASVNVLMNDLKDLAHIARVDSNRIRANWMYNQLIAFGQRIRIYRGDYLPFDEESKQLFGVVAPTYTEEFYDKQLDILDSILPGSGSVSNRFERLEKKFAIPDSKIDTVMKTAVAEARRRTLTHYKLPAGESFKLELVEDKPWNGYNWYKGNYQSLIQINTDIRIFIDRAIDVGSHESYPGHHVYNTMLEKNLYRDKGWVEISLYPLFSPQSLIAEGSANYGIELAFPGKEKVQFTKKVLLPLAGIDTADIELYYKALEIKGRLNYARNEAARGIINDTMSDYKALIWLEKYCLMNRETANKSVKFIKKYRSYVINYNYGQDLIKGYVEQGGAAQTAQNKWERFGQLLTNEINPADLVKK